jgi:glutamine amidotransferase
MTAAPTTAPTVAIIDYGSGNLRSAEKALARAAREGNHAHQVIVTAGADIVSRADRIVLPGVGAFGDCMKGLASIDGMVAALEEAVLKRRVPFLGICVGMQLLATVGREHGEHRGLGWIAGEVVHLGTPLPGRSRAACPLDPQGGREIESDPAAHARGANKVERSLPLPLREGVGGRGSLKIPHMGWNELRVLHPHPLLDGMHDGSETYFVHSYEFRTKDHAHTLAVTDYGGPIAAVIGRDNIAGVQFHPEKSQRVGLQLLARFLTWSP